MSDSKVVGTGAVAGAPVESVESVAEGLEGALGFMLGSTVGEGDVVLSCVVPGGLAGTSGLPETPGVTDEQAASSRIPNGPAATDNGFVMTRL